jgi:hypothetical protein
VAASDTTWIGDIAGARDELQKATEQADAKLLKQAILGLNRTLSIQPTRISTRLTEAARALRLPALMDCLTLARDHLNSPGLKADRVRQTQTGLEALDRLSKNLQTRVENRDR